MAKGTTKLYQNTGSPLISGRSKTARPFWRDVVAAWLLSVAVIASVGAIASAMWDQPNDAGWAWVGLVFEPGTFAAAAAFAAVPSVIGVLSGVWVARRMGWRSSWAVGAAIGVLAGFVWLAMSAVDLARA